MDELIYEAITRILKEQRPGWDYVFENKMLKINTNDNFVDHDVLRQIQTMGFHVAEIGHLKELGIIFSVIEENLE